MSSIIIISNNDIVRAGLKQLLQSSYKHFHLESQRFQFDSLESLDHKRGNLIILDTINIQEQKLNLLEKIFSRVKHRVVVLVDDLTVSQVKKLDIGNIVFISSSKELLLNSINTTLTNIVELPSRKKTCSEESSKEIPEFNMREFSILQKIVDGMDAEQISKEMGLSLKTIISYRFRLFQKLGVNTDVELFYRVKSLNLLAQFIS